MPITNHEHTSTGLIRCMTCGYVLGTNAACGTCEAERQAAVKAQE